MRIDDESRERARRGARRRPPGPGAGPRGVRLACLLLLLSAGVAAQEAAPAPATVHPPVAAEARLLGLSAAAATVAPLRWREPELRRIGAAAVGLAALSSLDEAGRTFMRSHRTEGWSRAKDEVERLGTVENFHILGIFFAAGLTFDDARARRVAAEGLASSLVAAGLVTPTLQRIVGRSRPRRDRPSHTFAPFGGNISFPSGHTTQAFAVASVIASEYDHAAVDLLAYGLAAAVGASRMYDDAHFLSDVTAAALIGTAVGRYIVRYGRAWQARVTPVGDAEGRVGVGIELRR